jgi:hypothetical protein
MTEKLTDPQAKCLTATGDEAEALEAAWQAHLNTIWSAEFHRKMDALVDEVIAENERARAALGEAEIRPTQP